MATKTTTQRAGEKSASRSVGKATAARTSVKKKKRRKKIRFLSIFLALVGIGAAFALGFLLGRSNENESISIPSVTILRERSNSSQHSFLVSYMADGTLLDSEEVTAGALLRGTDKTPEDRSILRWLDGNGSEVDPATLRAYSDMRLTAITAPALSAKTGYFPETSEFFLPEAALTRLDFATIFYGLLANPPEEGEPLRDCESPEAAAMVSAGLMSAPNGNFSPDEALTDTSFSELLMPFFPSRRIASAMEAIEGYGGKTVTRAEAVVVINTLLGLDGERDCYLPDIEPGYWAESAVKLAASGHSGKYQPGFVNLHGYLYSIGEDGYALKNSFIGSLRFDNNGRYTSGNYELDDYVAAALRENTDSGMEREEMLRVMYDYTRDHYKYLRRNYYQVSDIGWCMKEALTMYSTGMGNCYCYASAFWAAARGLGYDALCVSGTIGSERSPHGWVTISIDGVHYVFDVEIEMAYHRDGMEYVDNFKMEHGAAVAKWLYVEMYKYDQILPMERQYGLAQQ